MGTKIKKIFRKVHLKRTSVLALVFVLMSFTLLRKTFELQIIQGEDYISKFQTRTTKTRVINSTRGNIFDRNGELIASNILSYTITFEDNGSYSSTREKNLTLNGVAYQVLQIRQRNGDQLTHDFHIVVDENGEYAFDVEPGFTLNRFRADIFGYPLIDDMKPEEKVASASEMIEFLSSSKGFSIPENTVSSCCRISSLNSSSVSFTSCAPTPTVVWSPFTTGASARKPVLRCIAATYFSSSVAASAPSLVAVTT